MYIGAGEGAGERPDGQRAKGQAKGTCDAA